MGRILCKSALMNQSQSLIRCALKRQQKVYNLIRSLEAFAADRVLSGEAYDNARGFMAGVYIPINKALCMVLEDEIAANQKVIDCCNTYLQGSDLFTEDAVKAEVERLKQEIRELEDEWWDVLPAAIKEIHEARVDCLRLRIKALNGYLDELDSFDRETRGLHQPVIDALNMINRQIAAIFSPDRYVDGRYRYSDIDMSRFNALADKWDRTSRGSKLKTAFDFKQNIKQQFGFDDKTVDIMCRVYDALKEKYPNAAQLEWDWRFTRLLGGFHYDDGAYSKIKWDDVAGVAIDRCEPSHPASRYTTGVPMSEEAYFVTFLDIDRPDYLFLRYKVRVQHEIVQNAAKYYIDEKKLANKDSTQSLIGWNETFNRMTGSHYSEDEFYDFWTKQYNAMLGKGDFAHQMITTGTILGTRLAKDGMLSNLYLMAGDETVVEKAGWLGDATIKTKKTNQPAFGPDDYIADLDAKNIATYMEREALAYDEAINRYYADLKAGHSRATIFLKDTPLDEVKRKIKADMIVPEVMSKWQKALEQGDEAALERLYCLLQNESAWLERVKALAPDTYRFIRCLEAELPVMEDMHP